MVALSISLVEVAFGFGFAALALLVLLYIIGMQPISESASRSHDDTSQPMLPTPL